MHELYLMHPSLLLVILQTLESSYLLLVEKQWTYLELVALQPFYP